MSITGFPILNVSVPVVDRKGNPNAQFNLTWNRLKQALEAQARATDAAIASLQSQQAALAQLITVVAANVVYLNELFVWQQEVSHFTLDRMSYLQLAVADIAVQGGFTIPDPGGLLPWPGDPPTPPFA